MYLKALKEEEGEEVAGVLELEAAVTTACLCVSISNNDDDDLTGCTYIHTYLHFYLYPPYLVFLFHFVERDSSIYRSIVQVFLSNGMVS